MHPESSWVAKYTSSSHKKQGVYALHIFADGEEIEYAQAEDDEYMEDSYGESQN